MKTSDYIMNYLEQRGVTHIFEVIGGMITHLVDSAYRQEGLQLVSTHHEQSAAFAADAMGRITGIPGVAMATSGPGAVNLLTGIGSCYFDSVPAVFITGQVNIHEQKGDREIRQLGFQETDIVSMARPITKAAWAVQSSDQIPFLLEEAFRLAVSGRPGPVLLDIPMDVQRQDIPTVTELSNLQSPDPFLDREFFDLLTQNLTKAKRPLILAGGGIHSARALQLFRQFVDLLQLPVVNSLMAVDVLPHQHPMRVGLIGSYGNRWANTALGECDLLLVLGSRLDIRQTGADVKAFQEGRIIFHVDCESGEINNRLSDCYPAVTDLRSFLSAAIDMFQSRKPYLLQPEWLARISQLRQQWPDTDEIKGVSGINPNSFMHKLSSASQQAGAYIVDVGNHQMWAAQSIEVNANQRFLTSGGMGSMGFSLPAAIGTSLAMSKVPVVQICGDGGMQMNIQELQTIVHHKLPVKMVILNNHSYGMVRQFQQSYFHERYASTYFGYSTPDFSKVASAYGIQSVEIENDSEIEHGLMRLWHNPLEPFLLQVNISVEANAYPKIAFGHPITQMEPFAKPLDMEGT
ncbi:MAG: thiamine pyrophosphate-binding protein [Anaerolineales bacterium]|nr:thiamine pyrophosphate-binding protein [Anaerolineales bacterium]